MAPSTATPADPKSFEPITIAAMTGAADANGTLKSYNIGSDGVITGVYDSGKKVTLFKIALTNFSNPAGLEKVGDTSFRASANSGLAQPGGPGDARLGSVLSGSLEMSNVDLAQEFTNLIIAQRGFQATSRVITTSDQVLEELVNIKR